MGHVQLGQVAPHFALADKDGIIHSLASLSTPYAVIYFYPKDDTPGCTIEAKEFTRNLEMLRRAGATVYGISGGDDRTKAKFCDKHSLSVTLLSDTDFSVAKAFGAFGEKTFMGNKYLGVFRKTFVVTREGKVVGIFDQVVPENHAEEVLAFIRAGAVMAPPPPPVVVEVPKHVKPQPRMGARRKRPSARKPSRKRAVSTVKRSKPAKRSTAARATKKKVAKRR